VPLTYQERFLAASEASPWNSLPPPPISFRVGLVFRATSSPNPTDQNQDFRIRLEDTHGNLSSAALASTYAPIFPPWKTREGGLKRSWVW
jgi:hypothetical protein